jgi:hypothetical protein
MQHRSRRKGLLALAGGLTILLVGPLLIPVPPLKDALPPTDLADDDSIFLEISCMDLSPACTHGIQSWSHSASLAR